MLLQTPGAGPSALQVGTAGQHGSSSTTTISDAKGEVIVKPSLALSAQRLSGTIRPSRATPLSARDGLYGRGSRKGKEKEIVDVHYSDAQIQADSEDGKSSSIPDLLPLLAIVNFDNLLDEVIFKFVSNTSSILQRIVLSRFGSCRVPRLHGLRTLVKAAKLQGHNMRKGCKYENGLGSIVVEGQRRLAGGFGGTESTVIVDDEELD
ncbi:hypothetical protein FRC00_001849 [Tulasnella sp. 408]|nr:hypothetical protein FRC00_001849 [Tulasnella sp. 408]